MSREIIVQDQTLSELVVALDEETVEIFSQTSENLIKTIFRNDPNNPFLLRNTGFSMAKQIQTWIDGYRQTLETNGSLESFKNGFIRKTISDVTGFYFEYLSGQDIFPIKVEKIEQSENEVIVYAKDYDKELKDLALPEERDGALAEGVNKAVEIISQSGENTIVILDSPAGWSGLVQEDGRQITFPDNQTYVYWINGDRDLEGITIRTDIDLTSSENLIGTKDRHIQTKERLKEIVRSPISQDANTIEVALDLIEQASGKKFDKQRKEIQNRKELFSLNGEANQIVQNLKIFLDNNISPINKTNIRCFIEAVGKTILDLSRFTLEPKQEKVYKNYIITIGSYQNNIEPPNYYQLAYQVSQIPGCNGGGNSSYSTITMTPEYYSNMTQVSTESTNSCPTCGTKLVCGHCKTCKKIVKKM